MDAHGLKMWRKRQRLTQADAGKLLGVDARTWRRYEAGASPVPAHVIAHCTAHPAPDPQAPPAPTDEPAQTAAAIKLANDYIAGVRGLVAKFGAATPWRWALSYWFEGALRAPQVFWGGNGHTPCRPALDAANATLKAFFDTGGVYRMAAELDDCPADIRAHAAALP